MLTPASISWYTRRENNAKIPYCPVLDAYAPCISSLEQLKKLSLRDLMVGQRTKDSCIIGRCYRPSSRSWARLVFAIEDEARSFGIATPEYHPRETDRYTEKAIQTREFFILRIDHPSDLYVLEGDKAVIGKKYAALQGPLRDARITGTSTEDYVRTGNPGSWCRFSNINHSCVPNTAYAFPDDVMIICAQRTIEKDEEITLSYRDPGANSENASFALNLYFEFTCDCTPCTAERHIAPEVRKRCSKLQSQAPEMPSLFVADKPQTESAAVAAIKPMIVLRNCLTATFGIEPTIAESLLMQLKEIVGVRGLEAAAERLGEFTTDVHCLHRVDPKGSGLPQLGLHAESMEEALKLLEMNGF
ncbi:hypothetical protein B0A48_01693 [Cryoendolithus antarcticus]|uniref:SET domain-containing protein n=1 Tax=Cryoendolithus antarcticus TaxID=1507870 RepID=A0A1V8TQ39_9PEZI|nr:hypothetical protein B0A48_01693 [Cryoendolithus antarcticus]